MKYHLTTLTAIAISLQLTDGCVPPGQRSSEIASIYPTCSYGKPQQVDLIVNSADPKDLKLVQTIFPKATFCMDERSANEDRFDVRGRIVRAIHVGVFNSPAEGRKAAEKVLKLDKPLDLELMYSF
jgi:hypothetical protein